MQISEGLKYIHSFKIIHRDIKPANLLINKQNILKISDFGVSREYNTMEYVKTFIGTPYYLAPEMVSGLNYNNNVDYWAVGCILYELISLKKAFNGRSMAIIVNNITRSRYNINIIPLKYKNLIKNLLNKNSRVRYNYDEINNFFNNKLQSIDENKELEISNINKYKVLPNINKNKIIEKKQPLLLPDIKSKFTPKKNNKQSFYNLGFY
jgi:NIMA (never in mitosis gene a)-related kinase